MAISLETLNFDGDIFVVVQSQEDFSSNPTVNFAKQATAILNPV